MNFALRTKKRKVGISTTVAIAALVVVLIIAAAGWGVYLSSPAGKTITQTVSTGGAAGQTVTQTVTQTAGGGSASSGSTSASSSTVSHPTYLPPTNSSVSFTLAAYGGATPAALFPFTQQQGFFKKYVPNAQIESVTGSQPAQALASGAAQMAQTDPTAFVPLISQGAKISLVANILSIPVDWVVLVASNSSYHTLSSIHGLTIGTSTAGSSTYYDILYTLNKAMGWKINTDFKMSYFGTLPAEEAAVATGAVAATFQNLGSSISLLESGQFRSIYNFTINYPSQGIWASDSFIQQHPDAVLATIEAYLAAAALWNSNSTVAISFLQSQYKLTPSGAAFSYSADVYSQDGYISISAEQIAVSILAFGGGINSTVNMADYVAPGFVPIVT